MTQSPIGASSPSPSNAHWRATSVPQESYAPVVPSFNRSCARSIALAKQAESSKLSMATGMSKLESEFERQLVAAGLPEPVREYRILPDRRFRWDFCWPEEKVAVEVNGGRWIAGGHSTGPGLKRDAEKANLAQLAGWLTLTVVDDHLRSGEAIQWTKEALGL